MLSEKTDGELVELYRDSADQNAIRVLVERHHLRLYKRFLYETGNEEDANDLSQKLWLQVHKNIHNYEDQGRFPNFLSTIARNLIYDHGRQSGNRSKVIGDNFRGQSRNAYEGDVDSDEADLIYEYADQDQLGPDDSVDNYEKVKYLQETLIPSLPVEQRMAWMLKHESEHWDQKQQFEWTTLAMLNDLDVDTTWSAFESARAKYMSGQVAGDDGVEPLEQLVFVVWTQANRAHKDNAYTWKYFSGLLDVSENTLRSRYKYAQEKLAEGLQEFQSEG